MTELRIGTFSRSVLIDVCTATGRFDELGVSITEVPVTSSPGQFRSLADGELDGVVTNPDNVIAYRFVPKNPLGELLDVRITAALDRGLGLTLGLRPSLGGADQVRGGVLSVDVPTSGFAFLAYELLAARGITKDDYEIIAQGSTPFRGEALARGECDATILNAGNELVAQRHGCSLEGSTADIGPYLGAVFARLNSGPHTELLDAVAGALVDTADELREGQHRAEALAAAERLLELSPAEAEQHLAVLLSTENGLVADGASDRASVTTLLTLRQRHLPAPELETVPDRLDELLIGRAAALL